MLLRYRDHLQNRGGNFKKRTNIFKVSVLFPVSREFCGGDRFEDDCLRHHAFAGIDRDGDCAEKAPIAGPFVPLKCHGASLDERVGQFGGPSLARNIPFLAPSRRQRSSTRSIPLPAQSPLRW